MILAYTTIAVVSGLIMLISGAVMRSGIPCLFDLSATDAVSSSIFAAQELQTINTRFEARPWLKWVPSSLKKLDPGTLIRYHEEHEVPRAWWAWDITLSWLIADNHPASDLKFAIFNHTSEDEVPEEAIASHPWMAPLRQSPISRKDMAQVVDFLSRNGARMIVLDRDFPQYDRDDRALALAIHRAAAGSSGLPKVPVFFVRSLNRHNAGALQVEGYATRSGVLEELSSLEPDTDVNAKYCGITGVLPDSDQVTRRAAIRIPAVSGEAFKSIPLKVMEKLNPAHADRLPDSVDIDFAGPPGLLYPIRNLFYLFDPSLKESMADPAGRSRDISIKDAIVIIGDGVTDVFETAVTGQDVDLMSGSELIAQSIDTLNRQSWPVRANVPTSALYLALISLFCAVAWCGWTRGLSALLFKKLSGHQNIKFAVRIVADLVSMSLLIGSTVLIACLLFAHCRLTVPIVVPAAAQILAALAVAFLEREEETTEKYQLKVEAAEEKLRFTKEKYEAEILRKEAESRTREIVNDQKRRVEFARRIKHDLNAPISVLNWTVAELIEEDLSESERQEKLARLERNSERLGQLMEQLMQTYEAAPAQADTEAVAYCDLTQVVRDCVDLEIPLAQFRESTLTASSAFGPHPIRAKALDAARIIDNLIRNALKHNPEGTAVHVTLASDANWHLVTVSDNGRGIAQEHLEHIFEPGFRVRNDRDGQGLGLDIVSQLVKQLDGEITVESSVGKGTSFYVRFPVLDAAARSGAGEPPALPDKAATAS